jgi:hypothetical protein
MHFIILVHKLYSDFISQKIREASFSFVILLDMWILTSTFSVHLTFIELDIKDIVAAKHCAALRGCEALWGTQVTDN